MAMPQGRVAAVGEAGCGGLKSCGEDDRVSVASTTGGLSKSKHRRNRRHKADGHRAAVQFVLRRVYTAACSSCATPSMSRRLYTDAMTQTDAAYVMEPDMLALQEHIRYLEEQRNNDKLRIVGLHGRLREMRRRNGLDSSASSSDISVSGAGTDKESGSGWNGTDDIDDSEAQVTGQEGLPSPSLHDVAEVGDVALIQGLQSAEGAKLNGHYGKVRDWNSSSGRFAVLVQGRSVAIQAVNLQVGMKKDELTDADEAPLLSMTPTPQEVRELPWIEQMRALGRL